MNRRVPMNRWLVRALPATVCVAGMLVLGLSGCLSTPNVLRPQAAEETERDRYGIKSIGGLFEVGSLQATPVGGVGLVTGLDGTGGDSPHDENRTALEKYLRTKDCTNVNEILNGGEAALVIVYGSIPAGAHVGDRFDVDVVLPHGSKATSLQGGILEDCVLCTYDYAHGPQGAISTLKGHPIARAKGPLQLSLGKSDGDNDTERQGHAHVWMGGQSKIENPLNLLLNSDQQFSRVSNVLATRINDSIPGSASATVKLAKAEGKIGVSLRVPPAYRLNIPHYLLVVRLVPMQESDENTSGEKGQPKSYRQRLAEDLLDPTRTVTSALRLEALGEKSIPVLKHGLESPHPLVRFCSAESLTYLGCAAGAKELGDLVDKQPLLSSYALAALGSLDESVTRYTLQQLMENSLSPETRYGAFRALRTLDPNYPVTRGEELNRAFWLHCQAPNTPPLVHLCTFKRCEIVLFGTEPQFLPPFAFESNGFTITAAANEDRCLVSYVPRREKPIQRSCSLEVKAVLRLLGQMGASYPDVVNLLVEAGNCKRLNCPVALNALPQVPTVEEVAASGKAGSTQLDLGGQDLGETPTLYEKPKSEVRNPKSEIRNKSENDPSSSQSGSGY